MIPQSLIKRSRLEAALGLLLPCNVIVYEDGGKSVVAAVDAAKMMTVVGKPELEALAAQVNEKLQRAIAKLECGVVLKVRIRNARLDMVCNIHRRLRGFNALGIAKTWRANLSEQQMRRRVST